VIDLDQCTLHVLHKKMIPVLLFLKFRKDKKEETDSVTVRYDITMTHEMKSIMSGYLLSSRATFVCEHNSSAHLSILIRSL
jgi:hypothetical protein